MEDINPCLGLLICVRRHLERGQSVRPAVLEYLKSESGEFAIDVGKWYSLWQQGLSTDTITHKQKSIYRKILLQTLERGLAGEPIYTYLQNLEGEVVQACEHSLAQTLGRLPFLLLAPLLLLQMPAFLLLLFGPILSQFLEALGGP